MHGDRNSREYGFDRFFRSGLLVFGIVGVGIVLRLAQYLSNRSFWQDECLLALNIVGRPLAELLGPLDLHQAAPPGFLVVERVAVALFGNNEFAFRLFPLGAGIAALVAFYRLAERCLEPRAAAIALMLFAVSDPLIYFSSELKPYSSDTMIAIMLLLLSVRLLDDDRSFRPSAFLGAAGAVALWFSFSAVFILGGIGIFLLGDAVSRWTAGNARRLAVISVPWGASLFLLWFFSLRHIQRDNFLWLWWNRMGGFLPLSPTWSTLTTWLWHFPISIIKDPVGIQIAWLGMVVAVIGLGRLFSRHRKIGRLLLAPVLLTLLASVCRVYPFSGRLVLFLSPILLMLVAQGTSSLMAQLGRLSWVVALVLPLVLLAGPTFASFRHVIHPRQREEFRPLMQHLIGNRHEDDVIYLWWTVRYPFRYYSSRFGLRMPSVVGSVPKESLRTNFREIDRLRKKERVWVFFSGLPGRRAGEEERAMIHHLDAVGSRLDMLRTHGASLYLYSMR